LLSTWLNDGEMDLIIAGISVVSHCWNQAKSCFSDPEKFHCARGTLLNTFAVYDNYCWRWQLHRLSLSRVI